MKPKTNGPLNGSQVCRVTRSFLRYKDKGGRLRTTHDPHKIYSWWKKFTLQDLLEGRVTGGITVQAKFALHKLKLITVAPPPVSPVNRPTPGLVAILIPGNPAEFAHSVQQLHLALAKLPISKVHTRHSASAAAQVKRNAHWDKFERDCKSTNETVCTCATCAARRKGQTV